MQRFAPTSLDENSEAKASANKKAKKLSLVQYSEKVVNDLRQFEFSVQREGMPANHQETFFPLEAFKAMQTQIRKLISQDKVMKIMSQESQKVRRESEKERMQKLVNTLRDLTDQIANFDEEQGFVAQQKLFLPMYCSYCHVQFWGKQFSPELTYSKYGFIIRRKYKMNLLQFYEEFKELFPDLGDDLLVVPRNNPFALPTLSAKDKVGRELRHSQDKPLIAVCLELEQLT